MVIITGVLLLLALGITMWLWFAQNKQVKELRTKTEFAINTDDLVKIEFNVKNDLGDIAANFNALGRRYADEKEQVQKLDAFKKKHDELSGKVHSVESSISQITLITDIGKDITSSLGLTEIMTKVFRYIYSSMFADEVHILIEKQGQKLYYLIKHRSIEAITDEMWMRDEDNILNWCFANNKSLMLQNAHDNYEQYVFKPIVLFDRREASSVLGIPFGFNTKQTGSIAVMSTRVNAFDQYQLDFVKSLASYIAVAIDNSSLFEELEGEKKKSDDLLLNILPEGIATELKEKGVAKARSFENVSVLFTDFVNFTGITQKMQPTELVAEIHKNFTAFDAIIEKHGLEKIKTIGDAYLAVCGLPNETADHAQRIVYAAREICNYMKQKDVRFEIRIGINSGPVVAGIVGVKKYAYDIWGDTVNTAARMEQNSEAGKINISGATYELIKNDFNCEYRGKIPAKNKGDVDMYFVS